jgi:hypothetical protein
MCRSLSWLRPMRTGKRSKVTSKLLIGLGVDHPGHERHRHGGETSRHPGVSPGRCLFHSIAKGGRRGLPRSEGKNLPGAEGSDTAFLAVSHLHGGACLHDESDPQDPASDFGPCVRLRRRHGRARVDHLRSPRCGERLQPGAAPRPIAQVRPAAAAPLPRAASRMGDRSGDESTRARSPARSSAAGQRARAGPVAGQAASSIGRASPRRRRTPRRWIAMVDDADDLDAAGVGRALAPAAPGSEACRSRAARSSTCASSRAAIAAAEHVRDLAQAQRRVPGADRSPSCAIGACPRI